MVSVSALCGQPGDAALREVDPVPRPRSLSASTSISRPGLLPAIALIVK